MQQAVNKRPPWAERIYGLLDAQGRTVTWLADSLGTSRGNLSYILNGHPAYRLHDDMARMMAVLLGVPYTYLFPVQEPAQESPRE